MPAPTTATRATATLADLFNAADRAAGDVVKEVQTPDGPEYRTLLRRRALAGGSLLLSGSSMSPMQLLDAEGRIARVPTARPGAEAVRLDAGMIRMSRVAQAGASVIIVPEMQAPAGAAFTGALPVMAREENTFRVIRPAPMADVADDADVSTTAWADLAKGTTIDWSTAPIVGFSTVLTRREQFEAPERGGLADELLGAIMAGLANAADRVLLEAIAAATPSGFTLAAAAAAGVRFNELRALVGAAGAGAAVDTAGTLRAAGIEGELTAEIAGTYVGAWSRSAVFVKDRVELLIERRDSAGRQRVTCWATMAPAVPDAGVFWSIA